MNFSATTERFKFIRCAPFNKRPERIAGNVGDRFTRLFDVADISNGCCRELYDLTADPGEQKSIVTERPNVAADIERQLNQWINRCGYRPAASGMAKRS